MQRLSICLLLTVALALSGAGFKEISLPEKIATTPAKNAPRQVSYYWYSYPDDVYNDHATIAYEENEMWIYYDAPVNQMPGGGSLIERGYYNNVYPHNFPPEEFLYVHY